MTHDEIAREIISGECSCVHKEAPCFACTKQSQITAALDAKDAEWNKKIDTPMTTEFLTAVALEAAHQRGRWGQAHDKEKTPADWFWLVGFLAGKALHDVRGKRAHHIVATGAALLNWLECDSRKDAECKNGPTCLGCVVCDAKEKA